MAVSIDVTTGGLQTLATSRRAWSAGVRLTNEYITLSYDGSSNTTRTITLADIFANANVTDTHLNRVSLNGGNIRNAYSLNRAILVREGVHLDLRNTNLVIRYTASGNNNNGANIITLRGYGSNDNDSLTGDNRATMITGNTNIELHGATGSLWNYGPFAYNASWINLGGHTTVQNVGQQRFDWAANVQIGQSGLATGGYDTDQGVLAIYDFDANYTVSVLNNSNSTMFAHLILNSTSTPNNLSQVRSPVGGLRGTDTSAPVTELLNATFSNLTTGFGLTGNTSPRSGGVPIGETVASLFDLTMDGANTTNALFNRRQTFFDILGVSTNAADNTETAFNGVSLGGGNDFATAQSLLRIAYRLEPTFLDASGVNIGNGGRYTVQLGTVGNVNNNSPYQSDAYLYNKALVDGKTSTVESTLHSTWNRILEPTEAKDYVRLPRYWTVQGTNLTLYTATTADIGFFKAGYVPKSTEAVVYPFVGNAFGNRINNDVNAQDFAWGATTVDIDAERSVIEGIYGGTTDPGEADRIYKLFLWDLEFNTTDFTDTFASITRYDVINPRFSGTSLTIDGTLNFNPDATAIIRSTGSTLIARGVPEANNSYTAGTITLTAQTLASGVSLTGTIDMQDIVASDGVTLDGTLTNVVAGTFSSSSYSIAGGNSVTGNFGTASPVTFASLFGTFSRSGTGDVTFNSNSGTTVNVQIDAADVPAGFVFGGGLTRVDVPVGAATRIIQVPISTRTGFFGVRNITTDTELVAPVSVDSNVASSYSYTLSTSTDVNTYNPSSDTLRFYWRPLTTPSIGYNTTVFDFTGTVTEGATDLASSRVASVLWEDVVLTSSGNTGTASAEIADGSQDVNGVDRFRLNFGDSSGQFDDSTSGAAKTLLLGFQATNDIEYLERMIDNEIESGADIITSSGSELLVDARYAYIDTADDTAQQVVTAVNRNAASSLVAAAVLVPRSGTGNGIINNNVNSVIVLANPAGATPGQIAAAVGSGVAAGVDSSDTANAIGWMVSDGNTADLQVSGGKLIGLKPKKQDYIDTHDYRTLL